MFNKFLICLLLIFPLATIAQSELYPRICTSETTGAQFLKNIEQVEWKKSLVDKKIANLEKYIKYCEKDPNWLFFT